MALGLRSAASGSIAGIEETSVRALAKLQQILPARLRRRVDTPPVVHAADVVGRPAGGSRRADRDRLRVPGPRGAAVRLPVAGRGRPSRRTAEPYRLVHDRRRWYLMAWDTDRDDWRTFRVDRMGLRTPNGPRFTPRELPPDDEIASGSPAPSVERLALRARVVVHALGGLRAEPDADPGGHRDVGDDRCAFEPGSDPSRVAARALPAWRCSKPSFEVVDSPGAGGRTAQGRGALLSVRSTSVKDGGREYAAAVPGRRRGRRDRRADRGVPARRGPDLDVSLLEGSPQVGGKLRLGRGRGGDRRRRRRGDAQPAPRGRRPGPRARARGRAPDVRLARGSGPAASCGRCRAR